MSWESSVDLVSHNDAIYLELKLRLEEGLKCIGTLIEICELDAIDAGVLVANAMYIASLTGGLDAIKNTIFKTAEAFCDQHNWVFPNETSWISEDARFENMELDEIEGTIYLFYISLGCNYPGTYVEAIKTELPFVFREHPRIFEVANRATHRYFLPINLCAPVDKHGVLLEDYTYLTMSHKERIKHFYPVSDTESEDTNSCVELCEREEMLRYKESVVQLEAELNSLKQVNMTLRKEIESHRKLEGKTYSEKLTQLKLENEHLRQSLASRRDFDVGDSYDEKMEEDIFSKFLATST